MRKLSFFIDVILYIIVGIALTAAVTSALWNKPMLLTSVRSNSMYPLFQRSDMLFVKSISDSYKVKIGDIVVFKVYDGGLSSKGWIVHRIISGDEESGYITKGDANEYTDQSSGGTGPIQRNWIVSKVITIGKKPMKIPLIGYIPLWMEKFQKNSYTLPLIAILLATIIAVNEIISGKKKKKKKRVKRSGLELQMLYFFGGLTLSVIIGASMMASSQRIYLPYEVSEVKNGILMGSNIGIIRVGDEIMKPLTTVSNNGIFPIITTINTKDKQITLNQSRAKLRKGSSIEIEMQLNATKVGKYTSTIHVGMFYPFLPNEWIYYLAEKNYGLALIVVSLIPGLPLMLYPIIDNKMRKKTGKELRCLLRRIRRSIPVLN